MNLPTEPQPSEVTPSPFDEPMSPMQILFSFQGRIPRKTYWLWGILGLLLFSVIASMLLGIAGADEQFADGLATLLIIWPGLAIAIKRWHDRDKSGWWVLINAIPVVGFIWALIDNGFLRGSVGANRFGDDLTGRL